MIIRSREAQRVSSKFSPEHDLLPGQGGCPGPGLEGVLGALHSRLHLISGGVRNFGHNLAQIKLENNKFNFQ